MVRRARSLLPDEDFDHRSPWPSGPLGGYSKLQADSMDDDVWAAEVAKTLLPKARKGNTPKPPTIAVDDGEDVPELENL